MLDKNNLTQKAFKNLAPIRKMSVSEWADTFRMLPSTSSEPGRFKTNRTPYMRDIMDAFTDDNIHRVVAMTSSQVGKALDIDTPIPTPDGWTLMRDLKAGDKVFDEQGEVCNVTGTSEIFFNHKCFELTFSDGAKIVADANHLWFVHDDLSGKLKTMTLTTEQMQKNFKVGNRNRYAIPVTKALNLPEKDLPIDSYTFGCWLGDGNSASAQITMHKDDKEIAEKIKSAGQEVVLRQKDSRHPNVFNVQIDPQIKDPNFCKRGHDLRIVGTLKTGYCRECQRQLFLHNKWKGKRDVKVDPIIIRPTFYSKLKVLGVLNNKHIPEIYLRASRNQRMELLRGLMDTDGTVGKNGDCSITQKNKILAENIIELLYSLGFKPTFHEKRATLIYNGKRKFSDVIVIRFRAYSENPVFNLERKKIRLRSMIGKRITETFRRRITDIQEVESRPVKCIAVDSPSHLYLAGKNFIPTHNSEALNCVVGRFAHLDPCTILLVQPTEGLAEKYSKTRIVPMILDTKVLTPLFNSRNQTILEKFFTGGQLLMTGSNSPANLASQPVRIVLCDEVDRFATDLPGEGDPVKLAAARTTTFWNYKIGLFSTPTVKGLSRIEMEYLTGTQEEWSYKCPNCGEFHKLDFRYFVKGEADSEKIKHYFRCPDCGMDFSETEMKSAEQKYIAKNPDAYSKGIRSFWVNAFSSAWLSWEQIFQDWEEAKGNPALEKVCYNTRFAESYEYIEENVNEDVYLKRRENYFAELPPKVLLLTAAVDVQGNRLEYEVVGWSSDLHSWGILRGIISGSPNQPETWAQLDSILDREFKFHNGKRLKIARAFIDSGFATRKVYDYCAENQVKGRFAIKGKGSAGLPLISSYSYPRGYGITLTILGVNDGKQEIFSRLNLKNCMMHFPRDDEFFRRRGYDETYFSQIFSEKRVLKHSSGVSYFAFEPVRRDVRNESLDLAVYNFAALQSLQPNWEKLEQDVNGDISAPSVKKARSKSKISSTSLF